MAEGNIRNGSLLESEENNGGNTDGESDDSTGDTGPGESDDPTGETGPGESDDPTGDTGPGELDDPTGETGPRETYDGTGDTGLEESDGSSEDSKDDFCFVYLDKKTNTATIDEVNENTANGPDDEETQGEQHNGEGIAGISEDDDGEISQPQEDPHDTDGFDGANKQRGRRNTGYRLGILFLCLILTWFTLNQMDDQIITPSSSRLPNTNDVNPVEETQNQNMRAGLCFSGSQHDYQFCNAPSSTHPMNIPQLMIEEGRYTIQSLCPDDEQAVDESNEQERGIQGLCPGGDSAERGPINTCSLDNWLNMVYTQLDNCPCLLREVRRLADDGIPLFVNLVESHRLWKKGHISEAKWKLCGNHDMRSSEDRRILTLLESQLTHCFNTVNGSNGLVQLPHVILQGQRDNGSEWQDIAEAVSAYETRAEQVMVFPRPPVFLSLLLANLGSFQEDSHRISPNITFAGERYYLAAVTYTVAGPTTDIQHLVSRVFVPNGEFSADDLPQGSWWFYSNMGEGRLVRLTNPHCGYRISMAHYVRVFRSDQQDWAQATQREEVTDWRTDEVQTVDSEGHEHVDRLQYEQEQPEHVHGEQSEHVHVYGEQSDNEQGEQPIYVQREQPEHVNVEQPEHVQGDGEQPEHVQGDGEQPEHVQGDGDQPEHVQGDGEQPEHVQGDCEQPEHVQGDGELPEHVQGDWEQPEHVQGDGDQPEHVQGDGEQPEHVQGDCEQPEHVQGDWELPEHVQGDGEQPEHVQGDGEQPEHEQGDWEHVLEPVDRK